jgi:hypothetical protein
VIWLRPEQITKILEITDSLNIHRENVIIPLKTEGRGSVDLLPDGRLRIVCPTYVALHVAFDRWLEEIREELQKMDLSQLVRKG